MKMTDNLSVKDTIYHFIEHTINTKFEDLNNEDISWAKKALLDYLGVAAVGTTLHDCHLVIDQIKEWEGKPECTILFCDDKTTAPLAALANGMFSRAADLDDVFEDGFLQSYAHIISPLLVAVELNGGCTGKDFITAFTIGADINCRMAIANEEPCTVSGRYNIFRIFGATAAVGKILNFNETELHDALGIAFGMAHGEIQGLQEGAFSCLLASGGFNAQNVLTACVLAKKGIKGTRNILDGYYGFYKGFEPYPKKDVLLQDLGKQFLGKKASIKNYPSSRATHAGIDAALELATKNNIEPEEVKRIDIEMFNFCFNVVGNPIEEKRHPRNSEQAKFSYPFCVACAVANKSLFLNILDENVVRDPVIHELTEKTFTSVNKNLAKFQAILTITMKNGDKYAKKIEKCKGHPENPINYDDVSEKFRKCIKFALKEVSETNTQKTINKISKLELIDNILQITDLLKVKN